MVLLNCIPDIQQNANEMKGDNNMITTAQLRSTDLSPHRFIASTLRRRLRRRIEVARSPPTKIVSNLRLLNRFDRTSYVSLCDEVPSNDSDNNVTIKSSKMVTERKAPPGLKVVTPDQPEDQCLQVRRPPRNSSTPNGGSGSSSSSEVDDTFLPRHYYWPKGMGTPNKKSSSDGDDSVTASGSESEDIDDLDRYDGAVLKHTSSLHTPFTETAMDSEFDDVVVQQRLSHSATSTPLKKLRPPPTSFTPSRRQRLQQRDKGGDGQEGSTHTEGLCVQSYMNTSFENFMLNAPSQSFDTTDSIDEYSFSSFFSTNELTNSSSQSLSEIGQKIVEPEVLDRCNCTGLKWSDECGKPLETVHDIEMVQEETCRVIIILMNAPIASYEFLHCEFQTQPRLKINDILKQLPSLRKQQTHPYYNFRSNVSDEIKYSALCGHGQELISILAIQDYFHAGYGDAKFTLRDGLTFLAVREGCDTKEAIAEGNKLLTNKLLRREIRKARIAGRALRRLRSSEELALFEKEESKLMRRKRTKSKSRKQKNKKTVHGPEVNLPSDDQEAMEKGETHDPLPKDVPLPLSDESVSSCSPVNRDEEGEATCPDALLNDASDFAITEMPGFFSNDEDENDEDDSCDGGIGLVIADADSNRCRALSLSDSTGVIDSLLETLHVHQRDDVDDLDVPEATDLLE